jgi:hypothetical protein
MKSTSNLLNYLLGTLSKENPQDLQWYTLLFTSDQEKTASSFSSATTTTPPSEGTMQTTDIFTVFGEYIATHIKVNLEVSESEHQAWSKKGYYLLGQQPRFGGMFVSCSAAVMEGLHGRYLFTREMREEFVYQLFRYYHNRKTIYFLPTSEQLRKFQKDENSVLNILFELGAIEVYSSPNNQPKHNAGNLMHLCVLNCGTEDFRERCSKFLGYVNYKDKYDHQGPRIIPRFVIEKYKLKEVEAPSHVNIKRQVTVAKNVAGQVKAAAPKPPRDLLGRFVKKVSSL